MKRSTQNKTNIHLCPVALLVSEVLTTSPQFLPPSPTPTPVLPHWHPAISTAPTEPTPGFAHVSHLPKTLSSRCPWSSCYYVSSHCDKHLEGYTYETKVLFGLITSEVRCASQFERYGRVTLLSWVGAYYSHLSTLCWEWALQHGQRQMQTHQTSCYCQPVLHSFIHFHVLTLQSLPLHRIPPPYPFPGPIRVGFPLVSPTLAHQVSAGLDTSFPTEAKQGSSLGEGIPQIANSFRDIGWLTWKLSYTSATYVPWALDQPLYASVGDSSVWELSGVQVSWLCWSSCRVPITLRVFNPSSNSSIRVPIQQQYELTSTPELPGTKPTTKEYTWWDSWLQLHI